MRKDYKHIILRERDKEKLAAIYGKIIAFPGNDHTLQTLTREYGLNRLLLTYGFKQMYSISIHRYVIQERIRLAQQLLKETDKQVKEIAGLCGYKRIENFSRVFKKEMGVAPSELRK
ncbi:MAG: helix-turn-helix transcriptional regulator [Bacteroidetes bacterium]|nr:helix-turn-helix transcriptional regulator [Bacteroidota bacterium]